VKVEISLAPEVRIAIDTGRPVVALESTIIAHGMPYPDNLSMAREVEAVVRAHAAIPATIAILGGRLKIGLGYEEIDDLARNGRSIRKVSVRDLPYVVSQGLDGATTVASTMRIAAMAGIRTFATGGIGGVHRGAERSFDISADMTEFAESSVAVVTAGAKAILRGGIVVANPIPLSAEIPAVAIEPVVEAAVAKSYSAGIHGKELTPFLLSEIATVTAGRSLAANIALVKHNAAVAADIAVAYAGASR